MRVLLLASLLLGPTAVPAGAFDIPPDPWNSVMWEDMAEAYFDEGPIRFDSRVKVMAPAAAEDQFFVPVTVDATALEGVREIKVVVDLNPIQHVLTFRPTRAKPFLGFRVKFQQASAIHVGARLADGSWAMGGALVDAAGGGCTAPAQARADDSWMRRLGETRGMASRTGKEAARMTFRIRHPMDTGLATGIPAFFIDELSVAADTGEALASFEIFQPVSENPTFTLMPEVAAVDRRLDVRARDTEGNAFAFGVNLPPAEAN